MSSAFSFSCRIAGLVAIALATGCAGGSSSARTDRAAEPLAEARERAILIDGTGIVSRSLQENTPVETVAAGLQYDGAQWPSPDRRVVAVAVTERGDTKLALVDADGSFETIHAVDGPGSYSVAWAPTSDSLLFGFSGEGNSGVAVAALTISGTGGVSVSDVGCSVSNIALSWGYDDLFLVGDGTNQYVVQRSDCGTLESIDARKLHEVVFGPRGRQVAYILRELAYDREAREYRPDSSLYVADAVGTDPVLVVGFRYRPHRPAWSPDGKSVAYDARPPESDNRRLISIFDVAERKSAFLNPKAVDSNLSEWGPVWSPSGTAIAYMRSDDRRPPVVVVRPMNESFTTVVGNDNEKLAGWLDDRRLILQGPDSTRIVDVGGREILVLEGSTSVLTLHDAIESGTR